MRKYDMHIHTRPDVAPDPQALIAELDAAGIWGGALFSPAPGSRPFEGLPLIRQRAETALRWSAPYPDRLYPFLFIHPHEPDAIAGAREAAQMGIAGFKLICTDYSVNDPECITLLETIAALNRPVVFHTGILWDGRVSSEASRPLHFEAMLDIPRLRFALAHCSWPWIDECIALYGKVLNSYVRDPDVSSEMFFDITPGTPVIYREELLRKLFTVGYDVPHNILFGTDCSAPGYNSEWSLKWQRIDGGVFDTLGVPQRIRSWIYEDNFLRFLGKTQKDFTHISPVPDGLESWSLDTFAEG